MNEVGSIAFTWITVEMEEPAENHHAKAFLLRNGVSAPQTEGQSPAEVVPMLENLYAVRTVEDIAKRIKQAEDLFAGAVAEAAKFLR